MPALPKHTALAAAVCDENSAQYRLAADEDASAPTRRREIDLSAAGNECTQAIRIPRGRSCGLVNGAEIAGGAGN